MPGFSSTNINLDEARLAAVEGAITAKIGDLDALLLLAPLSMPAGTATAALVIIGDPDTFDSSAPFLICVTGGGREDGMDLETEWRYVGQPASVSSLRHTVYTHVSVYIHPNTFPAPDSTWASIKALTESRERLRSRICDFLRADVFETTAGADLTLASKETSASGDNLTMGRVASIWKGELDKGFARQSRIVAARVTLEHVLC